MAHALRRWSAADFAARYRARGTTVYGRVAALFVLGHARHPELFDFLRDALRYRGGDVANAALRVLGNLEDRRAAALLVEALAKRRHGASRVAAIIDSSAVGISDLLLPLTVHARPDVRFWATTLLGRYASDSAVAAAIVRLGSDPDPRVRKAAVEALGKARHPDVVALAERLASDPVFFVRAHAIRALRSVGQQELAQPVAGALDDPNWWVRLAANETLWASAEPRVVSGR